MSDPAASFGDVTSEYAGLRHGSRFVADRLDATVVDGPDTVGFLDGLLSQAIAPMEAGATSRSLLLAPQGKLRALLWLLRGDELVVIVSDRGVGEVVAADLGRFKIRVDVDIRPGPEIGELWGSDAAATLRGAGLPVPEPGSWEGSVSRGVANLPFALGGLGRFVLLGDAVSSAASVAAPAGRLAVDAVRIESGEPVMGIDVDESTIPQEAGPVADAVDFTKGCYLGQELVARIDSRGHVNRHLRGIVIGENVLPPVGATVVAGDRQVGTLTSVAESLELRAPVALGLIRREVEPGTEVVVRWESGSTRALVRALPLVG